MRISRVKSEIYREQCCACSVPPEPPFKPSHIGVAPNNMKTYTRTAEKTREKKPGEALKRENLFMSYIMMTGPR